MADPIQNGLYAWEKSMEIVGCASMRSYVHNDGPPFQQPKLACIPSCLYPNEISAKAFLTCSFHHIDDLFDDPTSLVLLATLHEHRTSIKTLIAANQGLNLAAMITLCRNLLNTPMAHPDAIYHALNRMAYGGLIQRSSGMAQQRYLQEYHNMSLKGLPIAPELRQIRDVPYWMTTKTVQELFMAAEPTIDYNVTELWSVMFAPAAYLSNADQEIRWEQLHFPQMPQEDEMEFMIEIASQLIPDFEDERLGLRVKQLQAIVDTYRPKLPPRVERAYADTIKDLISSAR